MANTVIRINPARAIKDTQVELAKRLLRAGVTLVAEHQRRLNRSNPMPHQTPAQVGEYPRKRTGFLQSQVMMEPTSPEEVAADLTVRVGIGVAAQYGEFLAQKGFLGLLDTAEDLRSKLEQILGGTSG
ncbi:hypothetical protein [Tuwongella immobilis]|uniref:Uncharacterized protein n=1 Tax=Tuwongella immobilis TaxID=692036 RepID=A0A6C2YPF6_9BACT|nr:hypothetical protein [Tuwongella immobilis]VIP03069.1 unnamed protein product [Tuwongella immobilis]VTS03294.1 unnamed protein product [Tuwongella immobilis]